MPHSESTQIFAYDVFINYSERDKPLVWRLVKRLESAGLRVWFDEQEVKVGDDRRDKTKYGLKHSRTLILCMSVNAFNWDWETLESYLNYFDDLEGSNRQFIPLLLETCRIAMPHYIRHLRFLDWRDQNNKVIDELVKICYSYPIVEPISNYKHHIFVSYAEIDNSSLDNSDKGWVTSLVQILENDTSKRLGNKVKIWADYMMPGYVSAQDYKREQIAKSAIYLIVLSKSYLSNAETRNELNIILSQVPLESGRIFVLETHEIERPAPLKKVEGYRFWEKDETERDKTFGRFNPANDQKFMGAVQCLAADLTTKLNVLKNELFNPVEEDETNSSPTVNDMSVDIAVDDTNLSEVITTNPSTSNTLTWLHLSDWHQTTEENYDRTVITEELIRDIENRQKIDSKLENIEFIIFSGDLAFSGKAAEYELAYANLIEPILGATGVSPERFFIVPGNHDLSRDEFELLPTSLSKPINKSGNGIEQYIQDWLCDARYRESLLKPFREYENFISEKLKNQLSAYSAIAPYEIAGKKIVILGFNSALMCGREQRKNQIDDEGVIFIGEPQVRMNLENITDADIVISVMHHPFSWLHKADRKRVEGLIKSKSHFILHGHEHEADINKVIDSAGGYIIIPAGACYEIREHYNSYNYVHLNLDNSLGQVFFRCWSDRNISRWRQDIDIADNGVVHFTIPTS